MTGACIAESNKICSSPPTLAHGVWNLEQAEDGGTIEGVCAAGYTGSPSLTCEANNWAAQEGACTAEAPQPDPPSGTPPPSNNPPSNNPPANNPPQMDGCLSVPATASASWDAQAAQHGEELTGACLSSSSTDAGFSFEAAEGSSATSLIASCNDGSWEVNGTCKQTSCEAEDLQFHPNHTWPSTPVHTPTGETMAANAAADWQVNEPLVATCTDGAWSYSLYTGTSLVCNPTDVPDLEHGSWNDSGTDLLPEGHEIAATCTYGGASKATCSSNSWRTSGGCLGPSEPPKTTCAISSLPEEENLIWETESLAAEIDIDGTITGACTNNYVSDTEPSITCTSGGWSGFSGNCYQACKLSSISAATYPYIAEALADPANNYDLDHNYQKGDTPPEPLACENSAKEKGSITFACNDDGSWSITECDLACATPQEADYPESNGLGNWPDADDDHYALEFIFKLNCGNGAQSGKSQTTITCADQVWVASGDTPAEYCNPDRTGGPEDPTPETCPNQLPQADIYIWANGGFEIEAERTAGCAAGYELEDSNDPPKATCIRDQNTLQWSVFGSACKRYCNLTLDTEYSTFEWADSTSNSTTRYEVGTSVYSSGCADSTKDYNQQRNITCTDTGWNVVAEGECVDPTTNPNGTTPSPNPTSGGNPSAGGGGLSGGTIGALIGAGSGLGVAIVAGISIGVYLSKANSKKIKELEPFLDEAQKAAEQMKNLEAKRFANGIDFIKPKGAAEIFLNMNLELTLEQIGVILEPEKILTSEGVVINKKNKKLTFPISDWTKDNGFRYQSEILQEIKYQGRASETKGSTGNRSILEIDSYVPGNIQLISMSVTQSSNSEDSYTRLQAQIYEERYTQVMLFIRDATIAMKGNDDPNGKLGPYTTAELEGFLDEAQKILTKKNRILTDRELTEIAKRRAAILDPLIEIHKKSPIYTFTETDISNLKNSNFYGYDSSSNTWEAKTEVYKFDASKNETKIQNPFKTLQTKLKPPAGLNTKNFEKRFRKNYLENFENKQYAKFYRQNKSQSLSDELKNMLEAEDNIKKANIEIKKLQKSWTKKKIIGAASAASIALILAGAIVGGYFAGEAQGLVENPNQATLSKFDAQFSKNLKEKRARIFLLNQFLNSGI